MSNKRAVEDASPYAANQGPRVIASQCAHWRGNPHPPSPGERIRIATPALRRWFAMIELRSVCPAARISICRSPQISICHSPQFSIRRAARDTTIIHYSFFILHFSLFPLHANEPPRVFPRRLVFPVICLAFHSRIQPRATHSALMRANSSSLTSPCWCICAMRRRAAMVSASGTVTCCAGALGREKPLTPRRGGACRWTAGLAAGAGRRAAG